MDAVELNSVRNEDMGDIIQYSEVLIQFGFVTFFAAAFPLGPVICLMTNSLEMRFKIFSQLTTTKRLIC